MHPRSNMLSRFHLRFFMLYDICRVPELNRKKGVNKSLSLQLHQLNRMNEKELYILNNFFSPFVNVV
jgi:hypothetical protein